MYFTHYCFRWFPAPSPRLGGECANLLVIFEHFLLSWRATLTKQEGINESAEKSHRILQQGRGVNLLSLLLSVFFFFFFMISINHSVIFFPAVCLICTLPTQTPNLITPNATNLIAVTHHNICPSLSLPQPSVQPLLTRVGLHGNSAHSCQKQGVCALGRSADARENLFTHTNRDAAYTSIKPGIVLL